MAKPLKIKSEGDELGLKGHNLSVAIYWHPRKGPDQLQNGHSALIINVDKWLAAPQEVAASGMPAHWNNTSWYVSWLGGQIDWKPALGSKGGNKGVFNTFMDDSSAWGGEQLADVIGYRELRWPIRWVAIRGLDTDAMFQAWDGARKKKGAHWNLFSKNCATMVHTILKAGGGDQKAHGHKSQLVWWPSDIIRYTQSMGAHVFKKSSTPAAPFM